MLIGRHDHTKAALGRERQRALFLDVKLGTKDMHGATLDLDEGRREANP